MTQVKIERAALEALYDLWRGLAFAYDEDDSAAVQRLYDTVKPYDPMIKAALHPETGCPLCGGNGMNRVACAGCGRQADPPIPCRHCGRTRHGMACSVLLEQSRDSEGRFG